MTELVLSASSVDNYMACEYRWYLEYIEKIPGEQGVPAAVGLAVHSAVEAYYKLRLEGASHDEVIVEHMEELLDDHDTTFLLQVADLVDPDEDLRKARTEGQRVLVSYLADVGAVTTPRYVEQAIRVQINGIEFSMHIDLVDDQPKVRDLKVKRQKPRYPGDYAFQMNGGAIGFRQYTGEVEKDVQLDIMIRLKRDRPYHFPISNGGPVSDYAIGVFAAALERTAEGIDKGSFRPTGLDKGICKWCRVRSICEYQQEIPSAP